MTHYATDGIVRSGQRMLAIIVSMIRTRLALFAVEVAQEQSRILQLLVLAALGVVFALMALLTLSLLVVVIFWDDNRLTAIGCLLVFYVAAVLVTGLVLRRKMKGGTRLFASTLGELSKDSAALEDAIEEDEEAEFGFESRRRHG